MFKKQDLFLIVPLLLVAAVLLVWFNSRPDSGIAVIEKDGVEVCRFDLTQQTTRQEIDLGGEYHVKVLIEPGAASFLHSDCRDQICVRTGKLTRAGQTAICLPAKISVRIIGRDRTVDGYTG
jgi:hypothetical protein